MACRGCMFKWAELPVKAERALLKMNVPHLACENKMAIHITRPLSGDPEHDLAIKTLIALAATDEDEEGLARLAQVLIANQD